MKRLIWLDDIRDPFEDNCKWLAFSPIDLSSAGEVIWLKDGNAFISYIEKHGLPEGICFDHDLSYEHYSDDIIPEQYQEMTGYDCAKWLVNYCINNDLTLPSFNCHSANPQGKENILGLLNNYLK